MQGITLRNILVFLINVAIFTISLFLGLRLLLRIAIANPNAPIVSFIYSVSQYFMSPFKGIFPDLVLSSGSVLDVTAFVALVVYVTIAYLIFALLNKITYFQTETYHEHVDQHTEEHVAEHTPRIHTHV